MFLCKYCKIEIRKEVGFLGFSAVKPNKGGFYFLCGLNDKTKYHYPMDNLDYIEHLAKKRGLMV